MYQISNDTVYIDRALDLAKSSMAFYSDSEIGRIMNESYRGRGAPSHVSPDYMTFKGVYIRYLSDLALACQIIRPREYEEIRSYIMKNEEWVWS